GLASGEAAGPANRRGRAAAAAGRSPVLCGGETLDGRDAGRTRDVVGRQVRGGLAGLSSAELARVCIAYEPVWAIGTGRTATPEQAQEVHAAVRAILRELGGEVTEAIPILYGGSGKPDNAPALLALSDVDGALVGGASLEASSFSAIVDRKR